jgi:hypothetical protein
MNLRERLNQFQFDLETLELLHDLGRSNSTVASEMESLSVTRSLVDLVLSNRRLLDSVLLRLNVYSEKNLTESVVRSSMSRLNNSGVSDLLNLLYSVSSTNVTGNTTEPVKETVTENVKETVIESITLEETNHESDDEPELNDLNSRLNTFFQECVNESSDATNVVKTSEFYSALTEWWETTFSKEEIPDKKELKNYLSSRLGKATKNTWSNVSLSV